MISAALASMGQLLLGSALGNSQGSLDKPKEMINEKPKYGELSLDFEEEVFVKESEADPRYMFKHIWDIAIDENGVAYVLDDGRIVKFDDRGRFLSTIGKRGQGPGEFMAPHKLFLDKKNNLYVNDQGVALVAFSSDGTFRELIRLRFLIPAFPVELRNFYVDEQGYFYAFQREYSEFDVQKNLLKADLQGQIVKMIASFPETSIKLTAKDGGGVAGGITHSYSASCFFCPVGSRYLCFGENLDYRLFLADLEGNIHLVFSKLEKPHPISAEEKRVMGGGEVKFPPHRPFFKGLLSDEKGRIYIIRTRSVFDKSRVEEIDIFSQEGIYLYHTKLKSAPQVIKNGYIYMIGKDERDLREIRKLKIKNYQSLKEH